MSITTVSTGPARAAVIESTKYRDEREALKAQPIVQGMARALVDVPREDLTHHDGTPRFEFMYAANEEYRRRVTEAVAGARAAGVHVDRADLDEHRSIGGVARALLELLDEEAGS